MGLECGQPVLPYTLQLYKSHVLPHLDTVNYLELEVIHPTGSKVFPQLCRLVLHLVPVPPMPDMHEVYGLSCILAGTPLAGYQVHHIFGLASKAMPDFVGQAV